MFVYPYSIRPRKPQERVFEALFNIAVIVNVAGFVIAFADFYDRTQNTFADFFGRDVAFNYSQPLNIIFTNCSYTGTVSIGGVTASGTTLTASSAASGFLTVADLIVAICIVHALLILTLLASFNLYVSNVRRFRIGGTFLPIMTWLPFLGVVMSVAIIALIWGTEALRKYYDDFVNTCAMQYVVVNADTFLEAEYDTSVIFGTNLNWIFAPVVVQLGVYAMACLHHLTEGMRSGYITMAKAMYPWEKGPFCRVDKELLVEWTRRRANLMETLDRGTAIPVSPFPQFATSSGFVGGAFAEGDGGGAALGRGFTPHSSAHSFARGGFGLRRHTSADRMNNNDVYFNPAEEEEVYVPDYGDGEEWPGQEFPTAEQGGDEVVGAPDEVTEGPRGRRHRRHHRSHRNAEEGPASHGGEDRGEPRRHRRRHKSRRGDEAAAGSNPDPHANANDQQQPSALRAPTS